MRQSAFFFLAKLDPNSFFPFPSFFPTLMSFLLLPHLLPSLVCPPHLPQICLCLNVFARRLNLPHRFLCCKRLRGSSFKGGLEIDHLNIWLRGHRDRARTAQDIQARHTKHGRKGNVVRQLWEKGALQQQGGQWGGKQVCSHCAVFLRSTRGCCWTIHFRDPKMEKTSTIPLILDKELYIYVYVFIYVCM